jgi:hypothetical protein
VAVADKPKEKKKKATAATTAPVAAAPPPSAAMSAPLPSTALVVKESAPSVAIDVEDDGGKKKKKKKKEADERRTRFTSLETLETGDETQTVNVSPLIIGLIMFTGKHQRACHAPIALDLSFWPFCSHVVWCLPSGVCASADSTIVLPSLYSYSHLLSASTLTYGALVRDGVKTYRARRTALFCESGVCCGLRIFIHGHSLADLTLA